MTEPLRRSHSPRHPRFPAAAVLTILSVAAITALAPAVLAGGTTIVVPAIPGGGWVNSIDNTAGGSTQVVPFVEPGTLGNGALELTTAAMADLAAVAHPISGPTGIPAANLTGASWRTFVEGSTGTADTEAAVLKFTGYQNGLNDFTTLVVELVYNGGVTPGVWEDNALTDDTTVWQTTNSGDDFCLNAVPFCTFGEYRAQYENARFLAVQVGIGSGVPAVTTWADGVSLTIDDDGTVTTETFDFDVAATPVPTATPPNPAPATGAPTAVPAAGGGGLPDTRTPAGVELGDGVGIAVGALVLLSAATVAIVRRRRLSR